MKAKKEQRTVFIAFTCCGFVDKEDTVDILLALEGGGTDIIEVREDSRPKNASD